MKNYLLPTLCIAVATLLHVPSAHAQASTAGTIHVVIEQSDGTYKEVRLANTSSTSGTASVVGFDSSGNPTTLTLSTVIPVTHNGSIAVSTSTLVAGTGALAGKYTQSVTFSTPYATGVVPIVAIIPNLLVSGGTAANVTNTGFTLVLPLSVTGNIGYLSGLSQ